MVARIEVNVKGQEQVVAKINRILEPGFYGDTSKDLDEAVEMYAVPLIKAAAPVGPRQKGHTRPGTMRDAVDAVPLRRRANEVAAVKAGPKVGRRKKAWYSHFITGRVKPHEIRARNGKALRLPGGGGSGFATYVQHPGSPGNNFVQRAGRAAAGPVAQAVLAKAVARQRL